jgi:cytochrome b561
MALTDNKQGFGSISIAVHWIGALLLIVMLLLGLRIMFAPDRPAESAATALHTSIGVLLWIFLAARIAWRLSQKSPDEPPQHWSLNVISRIVQYGLLLGIAIQLVTGPLLVWSTGHPLAVFNWFEIPTFLARNRGLHETLGAIHTTTAYVILGLFTLHIAGALKHLIIDRDGVFQRMLRATR